MIYAHTFVDYWDLIVPRWHLTVLLCQFRVHVPRYKCHWITCLCDYIKSNIEVIEVEHISYMRLAKYTPSSPSVAPFTNMVNFNPIMDK